MAAKTSKKKKKYDIGGNREKVPICGQNCAEPVLECLN
jgi:hypothetical protein